MPPDARRALPARARDLATAACEAKQLAKLSVPRGHLSGLAAGLLYNRYSDIRLPDYLAFFGGRRFVPIVGGRSPARGRRLSSACGFPVLERRHGPAQPAVSSRSGAFGLFVYGVLNRLLIVTGLHHILNNIAWFISATTTARPAT